MRSKRETTYKGEFVRTGGIKLSRIDVNTIECGRTPGLYFAGELMDVDGLTGEFKFQHE